MVRVLLVAILLSWCPPAPAEVVTACEQLEVVLPDGANRQLGWRLARQGCRAQLRLSRWFGLRVDRRLQIEVCADMEQYRRRTGRPWFVVGAMLGDTLVLQPARSLGRVDAGSVVEHELAHWFIRRRAGGTVPRWLEEGLAQLLAAPTVAEKTPPAPLPLADRRQLRQLERRLQMGRENFRQMRLDYLSSRLLVARLLERVGREELLAALPKMAGSGEVLSIRLAGDTLARWLFGKAQPRARPGR